MIAEMRSVPLVAQFGGDDVALRLLVPIDFVPPD